ncbi:MAG: sugar transferase [Planctomycetes bacterium]|nr:sugar transferase [Planctomycetota bacterium]
MQAPSRGARSSASVALEPGLARLRAEPALPARGAYARYGRPCLRAALLVASVVPAALLGLPIALLNALYFRSLREVLFRQERVGLGGRVFWIHKFRTMRSDEAGAFHSWCNGQDGLRVTLFGRFLRNTHLDELPQLFNILRGEMDFIGPRPEMLEIHAWACERIAGFARRNSVRPGLTGLAQVTLGYADKDAAQYRKKLLLDRTYIARRSLRLDLSILARTLAWIALGRGWRHAPRAGEPR